ncbi:MAG: IPT/TIG domain-containing protein [Acidobacteria bacterium]|nr:IPT/TIG domain-containing protein [Acidobacteriota bacterium]
MRSLTRPFHLAARCVVATIMLVAPSMADAQVSMLGPTFGIVPLGPLVRDPDVAYDPVNHVYLAVWGNHPTLGRFVNPDRTFASAVFKIHQTNAYTQTARVAYSPDTGAFLVTWLDGRVNPAVSEIWGRILAFQGGVPTFLTNDFRISSPGQTARAGNAAAIAYSTSADEFGVAYQVEAPAANDIRMRRVGNAGQLLGSEIVITQNPDFEDQPSIGYNASANEFLITYHFNGGGVDRIYGTRVQSGTGAVLGSPTILDTAAFVSAPQTTYDPSSQRYFVVWFNFVGNGTIYGNFVNANGTTAGNKIAIACCYSSYGALDVDRNPISGTYLAVFQSNSPEDKGAEISATGVPSPDFFVTAAGGAGTFNPRVAPSEDVKQWLLVTSRSYAQPVAQFLQTSSSSGPPSLGINDVSVTEGNGGTVTATFNVSLTASSSQTITVDYATANGTASAGSDYVSKSGTLTFNPGTTTQPVSITVNGDTAIEPNETFVVNLSNATNAPIQDSQGVGTIVNDDFAPPPIIQNLSPNQGTSLGGTPFTITGLNFGEGTTVTIGGSAPTNLVVQSTTITGVTPPHAPGAVNLVVTNLDGQTATALFTYVAAPAPTVQSVSPNQGSTAGGTPVTIRGTGFGNGATVKIGKVSASNVVVVDSTTITAVTGPRAADFVNVLVTNPDGQSGILIHGYTYVPPGQASAPAPQTITPNQGSTAGGTFVTINGAYFVAGATVLIGKVAATNVVVVDSNTITAFTAPRAPDIVNVIVTNPDGQSGMIYHGYTYVAGVPAPAPIVQSVNPNQGSTAGGTPITITGLYFANGAIVSIGGAAATNVQVLNSTTITALTGPRSAGTFNVLVTNPDLQSGALLNGYTYQAQVPAPTVTRVLPLEGPVGGGMPLRLMGTDFVVGATVTLGGVPATNVQVISKTTILAISPPHAAGLVDVVVTNPDSQSGTLANGFRYK